MHYSLSFSKTSMLYSFSGLFSIDLINNVLKPIYYKDLNCWMSFSFITLILFPPKNTHNILHIFNPFRLLKLSAWYTSVLQSSSLSQPQELNERKTIWFQLLKLVNILRSILYFIVQKSRINIKILNINLSWSVKS